MRRLIATLGLMACSASMRPIPDEVEPVPRHLVARTELDAGHATEIEAGAARQVSTAPPPAHAECADARHRPLHIRQVAPDRWSIARSVMDAVMRNDSARLDPQVDATGHTTGLVVEDVGTTCLAALGFQNGDVLQTINGQAIDRANYATIYQSVYKAKNAVVRFERGGVARTVVYEIAGE